jgi:inner membrane protein
LDNLTHTLVGAALAEAGLKRRTALGAATLMIGANFPDIDVVAVPLGLNFPIRRGITHGVLALVVLPFVLAGIMWLWDTRVRRHRDPALEPADFRQLLILSALSILTHPVLDFMNTYGMRWLMPFVDKWFYADGLFIVDIWILLMLGVGVYWSRRTQSSRPARISLAALTVYVLAMLGITGMGRAAVASARPGSPMLVEPGYLVPWERTVHVDDGTAWAQGTYSPFAGLHLDPPSLPKDGNDPAVALARATPEGRRFLHWSRFPIYRVSHTPEGTTVLIGDLRYWGADWATVEVRLP